MDKEYAGGATLKRVMTDINAGGARKGMGGVYRGSHASAGDDLHKRRRRSEGGRGVRRGSHVKTGDDRRKRQRRSTRKQSFGGSRWGETGRGDEVQGEQMDKEGMKRTQWPTKGTEIPAELKNSEPNSTGCGEVRTRGAGGQERHRGTGS
ncbi:hypothetical protein B0H15DRAFT_833741 [Mycena belliarum]|uniref:Uncharacterized protein n=1 Tax=Mycena belliarum TaxID=1033014 RepID=A0AAD6UBX3_9AGAR|nr:hypothetical protein B0H15DRAFT_833741 [Mycena belliae]